MSKPKICPFCKRQLSDGEEVSGAMFSSIGNLIFCSIECKDAWKADHPDGNNNSGGGNGGQKVVTETVVETKYIEHEWCQVCGKKIRGVYWSYGGKYTCNSCYSEKHFLRSVFADVFEMPKFKHSYSIKFWIFFGWLLYIYYFMFSCMWKCVLVPARAILFGTKIGIKKAIAKSKEKKNSLDSKNPKKTKFKAKDVPYESGIKPLSQLKDNN